MENPRLKRGPKPSSVQFEDLEGLKFGIATVTKYIGKLGIQAYWEYRCDCGTVGQTSSTNMKKKKSCGCLHSKWLSEKQTTHGYTRDNIDRRSEYTIWDSLKRRCRNPTNSAYKWYGGRGINVCDRWLNGDGKITGFECFLEDMGSRPSKYHSIDRINVNGDYEPGNCRWATYIEQNRNRRSNHKVLWGEEEITLQEACDRAGLADVTVHARLRRGWTMQKALSEPSSRTGKGGASMGIKIKDSRDEGTPFAVSAIMQRINDRGKK